MLRARTFGNDVWRCPCGGRRKVLALVTNPATAEALLLQLGLLEDEPSTPMPHGPEPPQLCLPF